MYYDSIFGRVKYGLDMFLTGVCEIHPLDLWEVLICVMIGMLYLNRCIFVKRLPSVPHITGLSVQTTAKPYAVNGLI